MTQQDKDNAKDVGIWMPIFIGDMLAKTTRLTTEQIGAAYLLMMDYWKNGSIPNDNQIIASITRLSVSKAKSLKVSLTNSGIFDINDAQITSNYLDGLRAKAQENKSSNSEKASNAARARWDAEREKKAAEADQAKHQATPEHNSSNAQAMPKHMLNECSSNAPTVLEQCPSTSTLSNNNSLLSADDMRTKMLADSFAPSLDDVNTRLKQSGHAEIDAQTMQLHLQGFQDEYSKHAMPQPHNWYLGRFATWIKREIPARTNRPQSRSATHTTDLSPNQNWENQAPDYEALANGPVDTSKVAH